MYDFVDDSWCDILLHKAIIIACMFVLLFFLPGIKIKLSFLVSYEIILIILLNHVLNMLKAGSFELPTTDIWRARVTAAMTYYFRNRDYIRC